LNGCAVDANNNFYVIGTASGYGYTSPSTLIFPYKGDASHQGQDAVFTKFNANNNIVWSSYYGGNGNVDEGNAITVDKAYNVYITGQTTSDTDNGDIGIETKQLSFGFYEGDNDGGDAFIAEFNSGGSQLWGTYFGGTEPTYPEAISIDAYYDLYITGYNVGSMSLPGSYPPGVYSQRSYITGNNLGDGFIAGFLNANSDPGYVWGTYFGSDRCSGMCLTQSNGSNWLYVVGNLGGGYTPLVFPAGSYQQIPFYFDASGEEGTSFISQFNLSPMIGAASVNELKAESGELKAYPNPATNNITMQMKLPETEDVEVSLINLLGEVIFTESFKNEQGLFQKQISVSSLPDATYILKAQTKDKVYCKKITKIQ